MSPNKGETAHSCYCPGDISVCMREVLVSPWVVSVCVPLALRLSYYKWVKFPAGAGMGGGRGSGFWWQELTDFFGFDIFNSWTFLGGLILLGNFLLIQQSEVVIP